MHRHRQFGMRENPASDRRHGSRSSAEIPLADISAFDDPQSPRHDAPALCANGNTTGIQAWGTLVFSRIRARRVASFSDKFIMPSVPLKSGGIGWNISGNGFSLVGSV